MTDIEWTKITERISQVAVLPPYEHQLAGMRQLIERPYFLLADEMGAGKTKQVIDTAQVLYYYDIIDTVVVVAPASVRDVWFEVELGELRKHLWSITPAVIFQYHAVTKVWRTDAVLPHGKKPLTFVITNYDYIRSEVVTKKGRRKEYRYPRIDEGLDHFCSVKTLLVLDESSAVSHHTAAQSRACENLRERCGRIIELNGTPIGNSPGDLYMQCRILHPDILGCDSFFHFKSRYAELGGYNGKQAVKWRNLDELQRLMAPYVLRRLKKDCLDLPEKMPPVIRTVPMTAHTWQHYKEMRDHMVTWLGNDQMTLAKQAIVKVMRLTQITAGFIGGVGATPEPTEEELQWQAQFAELTDAKDDRDEQHSYDEIEGFDNVRVIGNEKVDATID